MYNYFYDKVLSHDCRLVIDLEQLLEKIYNMILWTIILLVNKF